MPYHWVPIRGNPGPDKREMQIRKLVRKHNGVLVFCGFLSNDTSRAGALIETGSVGNLDELFDALEKKGDATELLAADEL